MPMVIVSEQLLLAELRADVRAELERVAAEQVAGGDSPELAAKRAKLEQALKDLGVRRV